MEIEAIDEQEAEEQEYEIGEEVEEEIPDETAEVPKEEEVEEEEKKAEPKPKKLEPPRKKFVLKISTHPASTKLKLKRIIEIIKAGKFIIKDDKFKKLKMYPSLGIWDPFLENQYTKSEIKLLEIKKRKFFKKTKEPNQFKSNKPLIKKFKRLMDERRVNKKVKKKLTKIQKMYFRHKLTSKSKKSKYIKYLAARRLFRQFKQMKFVRLSTEKKAKPKPKKKIKIIKVKKSKIQKKTGEEDRKKINIGKSAKSQVKFTEKSKSQKKIIKEIDKTRKRHALEKKKRKKEHEADDISLKRKKIIEENKKFKPKTVKQKLNETKGTNESQLKVVPKTKEVKKPPKYLKPKIMERVKSSKLESKEVQRRTKKMRIKRTVLCKFKKRQEYKEIIYIDFRSPEITTDEDSIKTCTTSTIPRTESEQYLKFRKKNEKLEKIKRKLIDDLMHSLKTAKLQFVEKLKYEPVLKLCLNKKHLLSKFEIIEILKRILIILNFKIDRIKKYSKDFMKNASIYKECKENLLFREINRIHSDYVDVLEILKSKFDIEPDENLKTPLEKLMKLEHYKPKLTFKRVRFKYLKNIKKSLKERNKELKMLNKKGDYVVSDEILEQIFNSYVPLNLVLDDIPIFMVCDVDYQLQESKLNDLLYFNYCNSMDCQWDVTLDTLSMESDVVTLSKYNKRDIILEKYKRLKLNKPKRSEIFLTNIKPKRIKMTKMVRRIDANYDWNRRVFNLNENSFVMPTLDCKFFTIFERPHRYLVKDTLIENIFLARNEFRKQGVYLDPIKQLAEFIQVCDNMGIDFESYTKEELRMLKFKVGDLIFRSLYPDGFPRSRQEHSDDLNSPVKGDANKNVFRNIFDSDYHDIDESSSEPKIIKKVIVKRVSKDVTGLSFLLEEEEVVEEEEEMEEEEVEEEIVEENSTQIHIEFDDVNHNLCELVCEYNIKAFYEECVRKKQYEEEEARRLKYLNYLEIPTIWEIPPPPQSLLSAKLKFSMAKFLRRLCNYNRNMSNLLEYFKDAFSTKTMPGVIKAFNYLWNFGIKGSFGYKVVQITWFPSRNDLLFVLFSKKKQKNYGKSIKNKIGHIFVFELQYCHKPTNFIKLPAAPQLLRFNPQRLNYMAVVLDTCEIQIFNLALSNYSKYKPIITSQNVLFRPKIVQLHWMSDSKINESNYMVFLTFSRCGYIDRWQTHRSHISVIPHVRIDESMGPSLDFTMLKMGVNISCATFHPSHRTLFLLGTCSGLLFKCTTEHVNNTFKKVVAHDSAVKSIQFNILVPKIFLTYGDFRLIKIWDYKDFSCIYTILTEDYITHVEWAPFSSTVFLVSQSRALFVYDLNVNEDNEIVKQNIYEAVSNVTYISTFTFHHAYDYVVTVGCNNGEMCLLKVAPQIRGHVLRVEPGEVQPNTMANQMNKVQSILDEHREYHDSYTETDTTDSEWFGVIAPADSDEKGDEEELEDEENLKI
ncbi:uncharacterized protein isoform X2 [Rhodnius prolixus]|uniref:uncharacterized protein isoform X2 n=1 Tax=Rhodnius prolixus TaxID=13249 RepID=UPI003D18FB5D